MAGGHYTTARRVCPSHSRGDGQRRRTAHADPHVHACGQPDRHGDGNGDADRDRDANRYRDTDCDGNAQPNADRYRDGHRHMDAHGQAQRHCDANGQRHPSAAVAAVDPALRRWAIKLECFQQAAPKQRRAPQALFREIAGRLQADRPDHPTGPPPPN
jgi:hypothetical protein